MNRIVPTKPRRSCRRRRRWSSTCPAVARRTSPRSAPDVGTTFVTDRIATLDLSGHARADRRRPGDGPGGHQPDVADDPGSSPRHERVERHRALDRRGPRCAGYGSSSVRAGQPVDEPRLEIANDFATGSSFGSRTGPRQPGPSTARPSGAATATITINLGPSQTRQVVATVPGHADQGADLLPLRRAGRGREPERVRARTPPTRR